MSAPARALGGASRGASAPDHDLTSPRVRPQRTPAARPRTVSTPSRTLPRARARRSSTSAFWVFTSVLVTGMVVGVVSLSALVVGSSLRADALRTRIATLSEQQGELRRDVATMSAPSRVRTWARSKGMVMADNVVILRVAAGGAPGGPGA